MATVIVNAGHALTSGRMIGATPSQAEMKFVGWGTGAGTAVVADTTLFTEKDVDLTGAGPARTTGTGSQVTTTQTNDTFQVVATRTATAAGSVTNAGLFDSATVGTLWCKGDFTSIGLANGDSIQFTFKVKFS